MPALAVQMLESATANCSWCCFWHQCKWRSATGKCRGIT